MVSGLFGRNTTLPPLTPALSPSWGEGVNLKFQQVQGGEFAAEAAQRAEQLQIRRASPPSRRGSDASSPGSDGDAIVAGPNAAHLPVRQQNTTWASRSPGGDGASPLRPRPRN